MALQVNNMVLFFLYGPELFFTILYCPLWCFMALYNYSSSCKVLFGPVWLYRFIWSCMVIFWFCIVLLDPQCWYMVLYVLLWITKVFWGPVWSYMCVYHPVWSCLYLYELAWYFIVIYGPVWSLNVLIWFFGTTQLCTIWTCWILSHKKTDPNLNLNWEIVNANLF